VHRGQTAPREPSRIIPVREESTAVKSSQSAADARHDDLVIEELFPGAFATLEVAEPKFCGGVCFVPDPTGTPLAEQGRYLGR
jgi:hypothetical protein